jgi:glycosyltransferase involved in cell wall biosynthesis
MPTVINDWPSWAVAPDRIDPPAGVRLVTLTTNGKSTLGRLVGRLTRPLRAAWSLHRLGIRRSDKAVLIVPQGILSITAVLTFRVLLSCSLIVDVTERHDPAQFRWRAFEPYFLRHRWTAYLARRTAKRVLVVSSALGSWFASSVETWVVPPQIDVDEYPQSKPQPIENGVRLIYAGTPGSKDRLHVIIAGIRGLPLAEQAKIRLDIVGISEREATVASDLESAHFGDLAAQINLIGRVSRSKVHELLALSHFSILVRPSGGYADAGFPSKIPESLAAGCPVIVTPNGDLPRYIHEGEEGFLLDGCSSQAVSSALIKALSIGQMEWIRMSEAARKRALTSFDYRAQGAIGRYLLR